MYYLSACIRDLFKSYDCYVLFFLFEKSFEKFLVGKWITLEIQGWYSCKKLSKLGCYDRVPSRILQVT